MAIWSATLNQMMFLMVFTVLGFILTKCHCMPDSSQMILSRLENYIFIPALVLGAFIKNFNRDTLSNTWQLILSSLVLEIIMIGISIAVVQGLSKDRYTKDIYLYGLCFSNFGFMGNAIVSTLFPAIFLEYIIFTLVLWVLIYLWAVPALLLNDGKKQSLKKRLKSFINPMFLAMLAGIVIGLFSIPMPSFFVSAVDAAGSCMSPIAMLLTGMTVAKIDLKRLLTKWSIYAVSAVRLLVYPLLFILLSLFVDFPPTFAVCAICSLAMPLGLNTIIIPGAYGKDVTVATGMALVSQVLSCITIPFIFMLFKQVSGC